MPGFTIKRFLSFCFIILCIIVLDHSLKHYVVTHLSYKTEKPIINGILSLLYVQNSGVILGIDIHKFKYLRIVALTFKILLLIILIFYVSKDERSKGIIKRKIVAGAFLIGGGLSNCLDWMFNGFIYSEALYHGAPFNFGYGNVIDMLYLPFTKFQIPSSWSCIGGTSGSFPIFNIADIFIVLGCLIAIPLAFGEESSSRRNRTRRNNVFLKRKRRSNFHSSQSKISRKRHTARRNKNK